MSTATLDDEIDTATATPTIVVRNSSQALTLLSVAAPDYEIFYLRVQQHHQGAEVQEKVKRA